MTSRITAALLFCVVVSALGGFGAPLLCQGNSSDKCADNWRSAGAQALTAAGTLSALLAKFGPGGDNHP